MSRRFRTNLAILLVAVAIAAAIQAWAAIRLGGPRLGKWFIALSTCSCIETGNERLSGQGRIGDAGCNIRESCAAPPMRLMKLSSFHVERGDFLPDALPALPIGPCAQSSAPPAYRRAARKSLGHTWIVLNRYLRAPGEAWITADRGADRPVAEGDAP